VELNSPIWSDVRDTENIGQNDFYNFWDDSGLFKCQDSKQILKIIGKYGSQLLLIGMEKADRFLVL
jgi:hypothetical protein